MSAVHDQLELLDVYHDYFEKLGIHGVEGAAGLRHMPWEPAPERAAAVVCAAAAVARKHAPEAAKVSAAAVERAAAVEASAAAIERAAVEASAAAIERAAIEASAAAIERAVAEANAGESREGKPPTVEVSSWKQLGCSLTWLHLRGYAFRLWLGRC